MKKFNRLFAAVTLYSLAIVCALATGAGLTGCSSLQQGIQAYGAVAVTGAHAAADTVVAAQKVTICDLPYSAIQRDAQMLAVVPILCGPLSAGAPK